MIEINKNYNENCLETMAKMPDYFIDLTVTSPPYDDLRIYNGYCFDFESVAKDLNRNFIGCDINPKAIELTKTRLNAGM